MILLGLRGDGCIRSERFEIISLTGEGGMGMVYRAFDRTSGQLAALKILRADTKSTHRERFAREARLLAKLEHPSIVKYLAHGFTAHNEPFLAMEWLEGEDLAARLKRTGVTPAETMRIILHAAQALGVAHANGVVHRDIKPSNLFLVGGEVDRIKMLDFGIAHIQASADAMTRTGSAIGTPGYMAPEQARGSRDIDARADVFSLGCVMFECLAGRPRARKSWPMAPSWCRCSARARRPIRRHARPAARSPSAGSCPMRRWRSRSVAAVAIDCGSAI